ncbi:MAG: thioredoxin [Rhodobacteraceae bacterium]|nr:thioredoxin [Paracoccaceae bacterium]
MRLTCPNCGAQYEVPDGVIPPEGRDVQCSNCGNTWFQGPDPAPLADAPTPEPDWVEEPADANVESPQEEATETSERQIEPEAESFPEDAQFEDGTDVEEPPSRDPQQERGRTLDPSVSEILREEAEREAQLRATETQSGLESQPDLGLPEADEGERRAKQARDHMARIKGEDPTAISNDPSGSRRDLLPDIEEINSSLRSSDSGSAPAIPDHVEEQLSSQSRGSFARGFALVMIFAIILGLIYKMAPQIATSVPQADPMLSAYVAIVDQGRIWVDAQVGPYLDQILNR